MKYVGTSAPLYSIPKGKRKLAEPKNQDFPGPSHYNISPKKVKKRLNPRELSTKYKERIKQKKIQPGPGEYHTCYPRETCKCWVYLEPEEIEGNQKKSKKIFISN